MQAAELDLGGKSEETRKEQVLRVLGRLDGLKGALWLGLLSLCICCLLAFEPVYCKGLALVCF